MTKKLLPLISIGILTGIILCGCGKSQAESTAEATTEFATESTKDALVPKVILDCDMGYYNDDALALSLLLEADRKGKIDFLGVTLTGGNTFIDASYTDGHGSREPSSKYTADFLKAVNREDVPFKKGRDFPLMYTPDNLDDATNSYKVYSDNGEVKPRQLMNFGSQYGCITALTSFSDGHLTDCDDASDFLVEQVKENPGNVVIVAAGPTTNIARAIQKDPDFAKNTKAVYYMAGAVGEEHDDIDQFGNTIKALPGANTTPWAEYNVFFDSEAFKICLTAGFPKQVITPADLNTTPTEAIVNELEAEVGDQGSDVANEWIRLYQDYIQTFPYWDSITAMVFINPSTITDSIDTYVTVNDERSSMEYGKLTTISDSEYSALSDKEKADYGRALIIRQTSDFWDFVAEEYIL